MKFVITGAKVVLGLMFLVFGLNGFFQFIPMPAPTGVAAEYFTVLAKTNYLIPVFLLQTIGGVLLLANRFVPLALILLGPVIVNILLFHILIEPAGTGSAVFVTVLWLIVFYSIREAFSGIFTAKTA